MITNYIFIFSSGFLLTSAFILLLKKSTLRLNLLINAGIPLIGGIAMGLSFALISFFSCFILNKFSPMILGIIIAALIMLIFGIIDDWRELSIKAKFSVQIIATILLVLFGIRTQIVYIGALPNMIITFFWVLGITNAFNHLDVMDGLAASTAVIISLAFFIISLLGSNINIAILSLVLLSASIGFLIFNLPPAKIYMGNAGSHFLGFVLAAIAISISYASLERKTALLSPILILGLPLFDTAFLILTRLKNNISPFRKSNDHLALKLLSIGYSKKKTLSALVILCLLFCFCGILVSQARNIFGLIIITLVILFSLTVLLRMHKVSING